MRERKIKCKSCQKILLASNFYYNKLRKKRLDKCKKCNEKASVEYQKRKTKENDLNFLIRRRAASIKRDCKFGRAKGECSSNLPKLLLKQYEKQGGKCFYSGKSLSFENYKVNEYFATVDRLDPSLGYIEGNLVFCCSIYNKIKQNLNFQELELACEMFLSFIRKNKLN